MNESVLKRKPPPTINLNPDLISDFFQRRGIFTIFAHPQAHRKVFSFEELGSLDITKAIQQVIDEELSGRTNLLGLQQQGEHAGFWQIFDGKQFQRIEQLLAIPEDSFLRYSAEEGDQSPYVTDDQLSYDGTIGFRQTNNQPDSISAPNTVPAPSERKPRSTRRRLQPQIHVEYDNKHHRWNFVAIMLRFCRDVRVT